MSQGRDSMPAEAVGLEGKGWGLEDGGRRSGVEGRAVCREQRDAVRRPLPTSEEPVQEAWDPSSSQ